MSTATISIVSHGHGPLLHEVLKDLTRQSLRDRLTVIVTLNLADEPFDLAAYPELRIIVQRNATPKGFGANHNAAFAVCCDPWFLVVNPDVRVPDPGALERLVGDAELRRRLGRQALLDADQYTIRSIAADWERLFVRLGMSGGINPLITSGRWPLPQ